MAINTKLLEYAAQIANMKASEEIINLALEEFINKRAGNDIISAFGTVEYDINYDYKKLRGKR